MGRDAPANSFPVQSRFAGSCCSWFSATSTVRPGGRLEMPESFGVGEEKIGRHLVGPVAIWKFFGPLGKSRGGKDVRSLDDGRSYHAVLGNGNDKTTIGIPSEHHDCRPVGGKTRHNFRGFARIG